MRYFASLLLPLVLSCQAAAQLPKAQMVDILTNGNARDWQLESYKKTLGNECEGDGQLFTFLKNGKVQRKRCVNGTVDFKEVSWSLEAVGNAANREWKLVFSEPLEMNTGDSILSMRLDLPVPEKNKPAKEMFWRVMPNCKSCMEQRLTLSSKN